MPKWSHPKPVRGTTDDWLTPPKLVQSLGPFDLDPCASIHQSWRTATKQYTIHDDGLSQPWEGFVWLNPPFGPEAQDWLDRMVEHNNGIALMAARIETKWFVRTVWKKASVVFFPHGRIRFYKGEDGTMAPKNGGTPTCLAGYGNEARRRMYQIRMAGSLIDQWDIVKGPDPYRIEQDATI